MSAPPPPLRMLALLLPLRTLAKMLPVPLIASVPVRLRFSVARAEREADRAQHRVGALAGEVGDDVADIVDDIGVVAEAALAAVSAPRPPLRTLLASLPVSVLARPLPAPLIAAGAGQGQVLDLGGERVGDRAVDRVGAAAGRLDHLVEAVVDDIDVVAATADHGVGADEAVERVGAAVAGEDVVDAVAGAVDVAGAEQGQVLEIGRQRVAVTLVWIVSVPSPAQLDRRRRRHCR